MQTVINFVLAHYIVIGVIAYDVVVRLFPTSLSFSIINGIKLFFDAVVPNKASDGLVHK